MNRRSLLALAAFVAIVAALQPAHDAIGEAKSRAAVVVRSADGDDVTVKKFCVFFDEPTISGLDLLDRAGVTYISEKSAVGTAICSIDGTGCRSPSQKCFCEFPEFWGYWVRDTDDTKWTFASVGAADREVRDGSLDGWSFGKDGKPQPPAVTVDEACASGPTKASSRTSTTPAAAPAAGSRARRANYSGFAAFVVLFVLLAGGAVLLRRRRAA